MYFRLCINFIRLFPQTNFPEMMNRYKQLLTYIRSAVTRNYSEKSINSILDYISTSKQVFGIRTIFINGCLAGIIFKNRNLLFDYFFSRWTCYRSFMKPLWKL